MGVLKDANIVKGKNGKAACVFEDLFPGRTFYDIAYDKPSSYVIDYWNAYTQLGNADNNALRGKIFEYILHTLFIREKMLPLYLQATIAFVPNIVYDGLFYSKEIGPVSISMKTSLRERYKQADLEAVALKYVHRKANCFLLTLDSKEAEAIKEKKKKGEILGLDDIIVATTDEFDTMIKQIKKYDLCEAGSVDIISSSQIIRAPEANKIK